METTENPPAFPKTGNYNKDNHSAFDSKDQDGTDPVSGANKWFLELLKEGLSPIRILASMLMDS